MRKPSCVQSCPPSKSVSCPRSSLSIQETSRALRTNHPSPCGMTPASVFCSCASCTESVMGGVQPGSARLDEAVAEPSLDAQVAARHVVVVRRRDIHDLAFLHVQLQIAADA